jgi:hypothetical protein
VPHFHSKDSSSAIPPLESIADCRAHLCFNTSSCGGINLEAAISNDLAAWGDVITKSDVDQAASWKCLKRPSSNFATRDWARFTFLNGFLYATNLGEGFGTRDLVFSLLLLELAHRFPTHPAVAHGVDFVLYTGDKVATLFIFILFLFVCFVSGVHH